MAVIEDLLTVNEDKMKKVINHLREDLAGLRAGRATPALLLRHTDSGKSGRQCFRTGTAHDRDYSLGKEPVEPYFQSDHDL